MNPNDNNQPQPQPQQPPQPQTQPQPPASQPAPAQPAQAPTPAPAPEQSPQVTAPTPTPAPTQAQPPTNPQPQTGQPAPVQSTQAPAPAPASGQAPQVATPAPATPTPSGGTPTQPANPATDSAPSQWPQGGGSLTESPHGKELPPEPLLQKKDGKLILSKRLKIILGITGGVLLLISIAVTIFMMVYNNPAYAVADSLRKLVAKDGLYLDLLYDDVPKGSVATKIEATAKFDNQLRSEIQAKLSLDNNRRDNSVEVSASSDTDGTIFLKFDKMVDFVGGLSEGDTILTQSLKQFEPLVQGIDGQWIRLQREDSNLMLSVTDNEEASLVEGEVECVKNFMEIARDDRVIQTELSTLLQESNIIIPQFDGFEWVDNHLTSKYEIKVDVARLDDFVGSLKNTTYASQINKCSEDKFDKSLDAIASAYKSTFGQDSGTVIRYWVDIFSHQPIQLRSEFTSPDDNKTLVLKRSVEPVTEITVPEHDQRFEDIQKDVEEFFETTFEQIQALSRDAERQRDTQAVATALEAYYADKFYYLSPSDLNLERISSRLEISEDSLFGPGLTDFSWHNAVNDKPQNPSYDRYIYQAMTTDKKICDGGKTCQKFIIWYRLESDDTIHKIESFN